MPAVIHVRRTPMPMIHRRRNGRENGDRNVDADAGMAIAFVCSEVRYCGRTSSEAADYPPPTAVDESSLRVAAHAQTRYVLCAGRTRFVVEFVRNTTESNVNRGSLDASLRPGGFQWCTIVFACSRGFDNNRVSETFADFPL